MTFNNFQVQVAFRLILPYFSNHMTRQYFSVNLLVTELVSSLVVALLMMINSNKLYQRSLTLCKMQI